MISDSVSVCENGRLTDWLDICWPRWMDGFLICYLVASLYDWMAGWLIGWMYGSLNGWLTALVVGCLIGGLANMDVQP